MRSRLGLGSSIVGLMIAIACSSSDSPIGPNSEHGSLSLSKGNPGGGILSLPEDVDSDGENGLGDGLSDAAEETLLRQYRPYWNFDSQEFIFPISITNWGAVGGVVLFAYAQSYNNVYSLYQAASAQPFGSMRPPSNVTIIGWRENAPVYVDAVPMPSGYRLTNQTDPNSDLVWLHYWLFFGEDFKYSSFFLNHRGDWEHVCVLVEETSRGIKTRKPVRLHWHHHQGADIYLAAYDYEPDAWGNYHPFVWIEAGAHGLYRNPGGGNPVVGPHDDDGGSPDNPLDNPMLFMTPHWSNRSNPIEMNLLQTFNGIWGYTNDPAAQAPRNPLEYESECTHDYTPSPSQFATSGCWSL